MRNLIHFMFVYPTYSVDDRLLSRMAYVKLAKLQHS